MMPLSNSRLTRSGQTSGEARKVFSSAVQDNIAKFFQGTFLESFDALVIEDGGDVKMTLEQAGGGDLTMVFSDGYTGLDCTPILSVTLTEGADANNPQVNYVYILQSAKVLAVSTSGWPAAEHIKVGFFFIQTDVEVAASGALVNQNWNDHASSTSGSGSGQGHLTHMAERSRRLGAIWLSGCEGVATQDGNDLWVSIAAGFVSQAHPHAFAALDSDTAGASDTIDVVNDPDGAYRSINSLNEITKLSDGVAIGNNKYVKFDLWAVSNKSGTYSPIMLDLPSGQYNTAADAEIDVEGYADFSIPAEFALESTTGFLVASFVCKHTAAAMEIQSTIDQRGKTPSTAGGAGTGGGDVTAAAVLADNAVIRGDGGAKGVQGSSVLVDDAGVVSGLTELAMGANDITSVAFLHVGIGGGIKSSTLGNIELGFEAFTVGSVNYLYITSAWAGAAPSLTVAGADANIDLALGSKGTGIVKSLDHFDVTGNITVSGTVDGVDIAGTVVTAAAALTNLRIVRGDVAAKAVKTTGIAISDANEVSGMSQLSMNGPIDGVTQLDVDDLRFDGITISVTLADGWLRLVPNGTGRVYISIAGVAQFNQDAITLANAAWHANMIDTRTSYSFTHAISGAAQAESAAITVGTETNWSAVVGTQDAYMAFQTALNGAVTEKVRINSAGVVGINTTDPGSNIATDLFDVRQDQERASTGTYTYHNTVAGKGSSFYGGRARGEWDDPDIVNNADTLFAFVALGYDGAAWKAAAQIIFTVDGAPGLNAIPTQIAFRTGPTAPTIADRFTIQSDGDILVDSGTSVFVRDSALGFNSSVDGQLDLFADSEIELTAPWIDLTASSGILVRNALGIDYIPGGDIDTDLITVTVTGWPRLWWDESADAFALTKRLHATAGVRTQYVTDDVSDPPTDAELDAAFGDPEDVGTGFVGILDDGGAGLYCYICWTTGTNGEWFYVAGTKAV